MPFLDEAARQVQTAAEHKFLFRKLGLPFDYASPPDEFPPKTLATAKEARSNIPNPCGMGSGYFHSCRNHALLFDSYLLKVELGIESGADEQILDRLIGGLIRIATVAPKSFLVGGLSPDGRGFYAWTSWENHAAWTFAVARGMKTAAIAPESQEKFRSIIGKWIDRLQRDNFIIQSVDIKSLPGNEPANVVPGLGPVYLAFLLIAALASHEPKDQEAYEAAAEENSRARLQVAPHSCEPQALSGLLWRQAALSVIAENDYNPDRVTLAKIGMAENALAASRFIGTWRSWDQSLLDTPVEWDWRKFSKASLEESGGLGFMPTPSWVRLENEKVLEQSLNAMYITLLAHDAKLVEPFIPDIVDCLATVPWDKVLSLASLAPAIGIHARGAELNLWDQELFDARHSFHFAEESLAAKYLEPNYDRENAGQAGHASPPQGKQQDPAIAKQEGGKKRKRRRRR